MMLFGGKRAGKRGRGAKAAGFVAMKAVDNVSKNTVRNFLRYNLKSGQTDAFPALNAVGEKHFHQKKVTPPKKASEWLPMVHIMIGNMKTFINETFHGGSSEHLQEYLDEFCHRFNRRFWEPEPPLRLLNACLAHVPVKMTEFR